MPRSPVPFYSAIRKPAKFEMYSEGRTMFYTGDPNLKVIERRNLALRARTLAAAAEVLSHGLGAAGTRLVAVLQGLLGRRFPCTR